MNYKNSILLLPTILLLASCGSEGNKEVTEVKQPEPAAKEAPAPNTGSGFILDVQGSTIIWEGFRVKYSHRGTINAKSGEFQVENGTLVGGKFTIDMNTIREGEGKVKLDGHLKAGKFFDAASHPTSTFVITEVTAAEGDPDVTHNVKGNLTIKGITKNIEFPAKISVSENEVQASAAFSFNRVDWDVKYGSGTFFDDLGDDVISDDISITLNIRGVKG